MNYGISAVRSSGWLASLAPAYAEVIALPILLISSGYQPDGAEIMSPLNQSGMTMLGPAKGPYEPIGEVFAHLLAQALCSDDSTTRIAAQDLYLTWIEDGRFDPSLCAEPLIMLLKNRKAKANRLAESLRIIGRSGDLAGDEVARLLDRIVAGLTEPPPNVHQLLDISHEMHANSGRAAREDTRAVLQRWSSGSSQRAASAERLIALEVTPSGQRARAAEERVLLRLDRARAADAVA